MPGSCLLGGRERLDERMARAREGGHSAGQAAMATFEATRPSVGAQAVGIARAAYEYALEVFRTAGLSESDAVKAFHVFGGFILGFVTMELGLMIAGPDDEAHAQAHQEMARMLEKSDLPRMREAMPYFMDCDVEQQFEFGLDLLIEGIRARIGASF